MNVNAMFPSRFLQGKDLLGRSVTVTIAKIQLERMRPTPQSPEIEKYVLYTEEGKKGIVLSKTLASQIARAVGSDETDDWVGKKVTLYPEQVLVAGIQRLSIRAKSAVNSN